MNTIKRIKEIKLDKLTNNQIIKLIAKELYSKSRLITSKCKITTDKNSRGMIYEGEEYEIIGLDFNIGYKFILVERKEYEEIMKREDDNEVKKLICCVRNGWEGCQDKKYYEEKTLIFYFCHYLPHTFDYIYIIKEEEEMNEREMKCEEIKMMKNNEEIKCEMCRDNIYESEEYLENNGQIFHKACYYFTTCFFCQSKNNIRLFDESLICEKCFQEGNDNDSGDKK